ncbi:YfgM family protein [Martelella alba]|uniref:Ancillary SecYEG translocon subunit n=1 Tax=Martelella alba TaxID=2590451 RepID=A0ABY2SMW9_9HYPH|nr:tetratricopeptide repeat protein [Martelella alba]TKI06738.1 tetratricopeptide repeat protein [Martelella alba]
MEIYSTENEQRDALMRFFRDNGKALAIGVVIGVAALLGWHYWRSHQSDSMMSSSAAWQQVTTALSDNADSRHVEAAQKFADDNNNNYGALTSMDLARYYADKGDFPAAQRQLEKALGQTGEENLQTLIKLRLARVQLQAKNADGALQTLNGVKQAAWSALADDIRGDAQLQKGNGQAARDAYDKALKANPPQALQALLRMKLNNLSS